MLRNITRFAAAGGLALILAGYDSSSAAESQTPKQIKDYFIESQVETVKHKLKWARERSYNLKEDVCSDREVGIYLQQEEVWQAVWTLSDATESRILSGKENAQESLDACLPQLSKVREAFGDNTYGRIIDRNQRNLVNTALKNGLNVPEKYMPINRK